MAASPFIRLRKERFIDCSVGAIGKGSARPHSSRAERCILCIGGHLGGMSGIAHHWKHDAVCAVVQALLNQDALRHGHSYDDTKARTASLGNKCIAGVL